MEDKAFINMKDYLRLLESEKQYLLLKKEHEDLVTFLIGTDITNNTNLMKEFIDWENKRNCKVSTMVDIGKLSLKDIVKGS